MLVTKMLLGLLLTSSLQASDVYLDEVGQSFCNPNFRNAAERLLKYPTAQRKKHYNQLVREYGLFYSEHKQLPRFTALSKAYGVI